MIPEIANHELDLIDLCRTHHVRRLEIFGSALSSNFDPGQSDFDFLVEFENLAPGCYATNFFSLKDALERVLARPVDLLVESAIRNPWFRKGIEQSKALLYAA